VTSLVLKHDFPLPAGHYSGRQDDQLFHLTKEGYVVVRNVKTLNLIDTKFKVTTIPTTNNDYRQSLIKIQTDLRINSEG
jgi:hypothetical protein